MIVFFRGGGLCPRTKDFYYKTVDMCMTLKTEGVTLHWENEKSL